MENTEKNNWFQKTFTDGPRPYLWIIAVGFLVYGASLFFGFTYLDDNQLILDNFSFIKNPANIFNAFDHDVFLSPAGTYFRPLLTLSFMLDAQFSGATPFAPIFHFGNLLIHLTASGLLYIFLKKLSLKKELAFAATLIFTVHPALTQAVSWIPGRNDSLLALFTISSFIFLLAFLDKKRTGFYALHLVFFAAALFTKETAVVLPVLFFLYIWLAEKNIVSLPKKILLSAGWLTPGILWFLLRRAAISSAPLNPADALKTLTENYPVLLQYFGKIFLPVNLSVLPLVRDTTIVPGVVSIILVAALSFFSKISRGKLFIFGLIWFIIFILPMLLLHNPAIPFGADYQLEHRLYLPLIGIFLMLSEISFIKNIQLKKLGYFIPFFFLIVLFSVITIAHATNFKDEISFWENAVKTSPSSPLAHRNLGAMYFFHDNLAGAEREYKKTLTLNPNEPMVHNNLGALFNKIGLSTEAAEEYTKEITINPENADAYYNLGILRFKEGFNEEAATLWKKTIEIDPGYTDAYYNLAIYYQASGNAAEFDYYTQKLNEHGVDFDAEIKRIMKKKGGLE